MSYKIRVILNAEEDAIRDIAIDPKVNLEDLHNAITNAFGFTGNEMASFYRSDDSWVQGEEFPLFDMSEGLEQKVQMLEVILDQVFKAPGHKMIYVYDFLNMWSFYVELIDDNFDFDPIKLPSLIFSLGMIPNHAPEIQFESEDLKDEDMDPEFEDEYDEDFFNEAGEDFEDLNFN